MNSFSCASLHIGQIRYYQCAFYFGNNVQQYLKHHSKSGEGERRAEKKGGGERESDDVRLIQCQAVTGELLAGMDQKHHGNVCVCVRMHARVRACVRA